MTNVRHADEAVVIGKGLSCFESPYKRTDLILKCFNFKYAFLPFFKIDKFQLRFN